MTSRTFDSENSSNPLAIQTDSIFTNANSNDSLPLPTAGPTTATLATGLFGASPSDSPPVAANLEMNSGIPLASSGLGSLQGNPNSNIDGDLTGSSQPTVGIDINTDLEPSSTPTLITQIRLNIKGSKQTIEGTNGKDRLDGRRGQRNTIKGLGGNDTIFVGRRDKAKGGKGNDRIDARKGKGHNQLFGEAGDDQLFGKKGDRLAGGKGNDVLTSNGSKNTLEGGAGNDELRAKRRDRLDGGKGDDILYAGLNKSHLTGGSGADQFEIVNGQLPKRANTILDFELGVDKLCVRNLDGLEQFIDLKLTQRGNNTVISFKKQEIAILKRINASDLQFSDFKLDDGIPFAKPLSFSRTDFVIGGEPDGMTGADFDGDGDIDLAITFSGRDVTTSFVATYTGNTMILLSNNGDGTFAAPVTLATGVGPSSPSAADLDGDGDIDLLIDNAGDETISVLSNDGNGRFSQTTTLTPGITAFGFPEDVDGDGDLDIITLNAGNLSTTTALNSGNSISIWTNDGQANFTETAEYVTGNGIVNASTADVDNDGDIDIVAVNRADTTLSVLANDGTGTFTQTNLPTATNIDLTSVALGDLNQDGTVDLVTSDFDRFGEVYVSFNARSGSLVGSTVYSTSLFPTALRLVDFDLDGDLDIGLTNAVITVGSGAREGSEYTILLNDGTGVLDTFGPLTTAASPLSPVINDLDGDGDVDIVLVSAEEGRLTILENEILSGH